MCIETAVSLEANVLFFCTGERTGALQRHSQDLFYFFMVFFVQVSAQVRYNDILKTGGPGVLIVEGANPLVEGNRIIRGAGVGVQVVKT